MSDPRITIICGHYGVGKSEVSIALALFFRLQDSETPLALVDLDVVNPYFRSREARHILEAQGIRVIGNSLGIDDSVDVPAVPGTIRPLLLDTATRVLIDLGGDAAGARAIRQFRPQIPAEDTELLAVVNRYRPETASVAAVLSSIETIAATVGLRCTGLVNNSHLLHETTTDHLLAGESLCGEVTAATGLPVRYVTATEEILSTLGSALSGIPVAVGGVLRQAWMKSGNEHLPR